MSQLLFLAADWGGVVELHGADFGRHGAFHLKEEEGAADGDLIARGQDALLDGNAVDERAGGGVLVREQEAVVLTRDPAVDVSDRGIVDTNWVGGVSADRHRRGEAEFRLSERTAES